jgi:GAF domain-containing protein
MTSEQTQAARAARSLEEGRAAPAMSTDRAFLAASLDFQQSLRTLVAAVVPGFADWCWVDLVDGEGIPRRVEIAHADPASAAIAAEMRSLGFGAGWATPSAQAIRDRAPRLYREVSDQLMAWATHDARHLAVLRAMRPNSLLAVPLVARDRAIGAITAIRSTMLPALDESALVFLEDLAIPAALALDNARRYEAAAQALERAGLRNR